MTHIDFTYERASAKLEEIDLTLYSLRNVYCHERRKGYGNALLQQITDYADKKGITILLVAQRYGYKDQNGMTNKDLENWYKRFGFVTEPVSSKYLAHMIRHPRVENIPYNETP